LAGALCRGNCQPLRPQDDEGPPHVISDREPWPLLPLASQVCRHEPYQVKPYQLPVVLALEDLI
jgi:hypothetical protein